ncbi:hypothetical protein GWE18_36620 [Bradyrhizobium sp. CSA112]|nr:hypothetical protein [Bradyrhizobium sp. CSA112]
MKRSRQQNERAVSVEVLQRLFRCDAKRGLLFWRRRAVDHYRIVAWNKRFAGKQAGNDNGLGHLQIAFAIDGVKYYSTVHRVIWALSHGHWPTDDLDHRHGERSHNAIVELRDCTPSDQRNRRLHKNNTSGFKGVSWFRSYRNISFKFRSIRPPASSDISSTRLKGQKPMTSPRSSISANSQKTTDSWVCFHEDVACRCRAVRHGSVH